ncbi:hypothetical protein DFAR_3990045 [Desulfarculales bacterium]
MPGPMLLVDDKRRKNYLFAFIDGMSRLIFHALILPLRGPGHLSTGFAPGPAQTELLRKLYLDNGPAFRSHHLEEITASWASPWSTHRPMCPRAGARSKNSSALSGPSFSPASKATPFGTSIRPCSAELGTSTNSASIWAPDRLHCKTSPTKWSASGRPPPIWKATSKKITPRRVALNRTVSLADRLYEAPVPLIGKQIILLYPRP